MGAPLSEKNGNVISNLRTIYNGNLFKYNAEEFTKGKNNINNNRLLYPKHNNNINNINITNTINDPFTPFGNYINQFDTNNINNNNNNYSYQNQNILTEEQKKDIYLNQFR